MNEAERKRFLDTLRSDDGFRATVRRELLTEELLNLPDLVADLARGLQDLTGSAAALVDTVAQQRHDFTTLSTDFASLATDVRNYMERTITLIGEGFAAVRGEISELRAEMESRFTAVDARFTSVDARFTSVDARFDQVDAEIREIKRRIA